MPVRTYQDQPVNPLVEILLYNTTMSKTKLIVKNNQILIDADVLFDQIEEAGGDWKRVRESYRQLKQSLHTEEEE